MIQRNGNVTDGYSRPVPGATVYVYNQDGTDATLTLDGTTPITEPITTDEWGGYSYFADDGLYREDIWFGGKRRAVDYNVAVGNPPQLSGGPKGDPGGNVMAIGLFTAASGLTIPTGTDLVQTSGHTSKGKGHALYVADSAVDAAFATLNPKWSFVSSNGRGFRLSDQGEQPIEAFGAVGDATSGSTGTDDYPAIRAAMDFQEYFHTAPSGNTDWKVCPPVRLGRKGYRTSQTWNWDRAAYCFLGSGNNYNGNTGTYVFVDGTPNGTGQPAVVLQCWNTAGLSFDTTTAHVAHTPGTDPRGAAGSRLEDITFVSRGGTVGNPDHSGIIQRCSATLKRVFCMDFGGYAHAVVADINFGSNANAAQWDSCGGYRCGLSGWYDQGGDVNACRNLSFQAFSNREFGIYAGNFLGNFYQYFQTDGNGRLGAGPSWATNTVSSFTNYGGHYWHVKPGQHVLASTTTPGTDSTVWEDMGAGSTGMGGSWASGQTFCSGGAFFAGGPNYAQGNNASNVFEGYAEGDQYGGWSSGNKSVCMPGFAQFVGGFTGTNLYGQGGYLAAGTIGSRNKAADGHVYGRWLGGDVFSNTGQIGGWAVDDGLTAYEFWDGSSVWWKYQGGSTISMKVNLSGSGIGMELPRGLRVTGQTIGYATGAGGTVTQTTDKTTGVTLNKACGAITMNPASLAAGAIASFTLTNSFIGADDDVKVRVKSGNAAVGSYRVASEGNAAGSRTVVVENKTAGALAEALVLGFQVITGATS